MSLLSVTVKKARYVGIQATQFNTYVTLKLQNVKSTTVTVKGPTPCWEQDFLFEINDINLGLLIEVWNKGVIWDRALGYHYLPLTSVAYDEQECGGRWVELEAQLMMRGGAVVGTTGPTGHALLLDCRFEPPFDAEGTGGADLQRKLDLLNGALDAERAEQARRQLQYVAHSGYSEDSDYTSDLNFPVGQHANCSASQFRNAAHQMHTPQRSLEASRENSYEREEYHLHGDTDPLYYNSQPRTNRIDTWSQLHAQASVESAISWRTAADWQSGEDHRRPSLERQNTLYDDSIGYGYDAYTTSTHIRDHSHLSQQASYEEYYDATSYPYPFEPPPWEQRFLYDDCGLNPIEYENIINKRRSSVVQLPQMPPKQLPPSSRYSDYNEMAPYRPRPRRTAASLPATPSSTPKRGRALPVPPGSESGWSRRGRRLPRPPAQRQQPVPPASYTNVPYTQETERTVPDVSNFGYQTYGFQKYQDTAIEQYPDNNYTASDEDGMQPFFNETPHATPSATTAQKTTWGETESSAQFSYTVTEEDNTYISTTAPSKYSFVEPPVTTKQEVYHDANYQTFDSQYNEKQQYQSFDTQNQFYTDDQSQYLDQKQDAQYPEQFNQQYKEGQITNLKYEQQLNYQREQDIYKKQQDQFQDNQFMQQRDQYHQQEQQYKSQQDQYHQQDQQQQKDFHYQQQYEQQQQHNEQQKLQQFQHQQHQQYDIQQQQEYDMQQQQQYDMKQQQQYDMQQQHQQQQQQLEFEKQQQNQEQFRQQQHQQQMQQQQLQQQQLQQQQQQQQQAQQLRQQQQEQQQKQPTQQLQATMLTGAATLGSLMAGGAKKLGSFFGAAAAAVAPPTVTQPPQAAPVTTAPVSQFTSVATPATTVTTSAPQATETVAEVTQPSVTSATTTAPTLPQTPSLRRQESIQRPSVRRTRTLPEAPDDFTSSFDESAYEDEYHKTDLDQVERDRTSLDRYREEDYPHDAIAEDVPQERRISDEQAPSIQKTVSPPRTGSITRKPSVDSYHSQTPSVLDRKTSQSSFASHQEEKLSITTTQEESIEKSKVTFQDERTTYHEVPDENTFERQESFDEQGTEFQDDEQFQDEAYRDEKFEESEQFQEPEEQYQEEFPEERQDEVVFEPEQPKLTPRQRWHRAYNKIVMQLNGLTTLRKRWRRKRARTPYRYPAGDRGPNVRVAREPISNLYAN
ncbi:myb-like protein K [Colias croceus]|uniref:myb-like protein K n=1 Tax=Colias crocea TaxID=72248 RepID=UPI001E27E0ED|nr:myb-like protein K [Colias croceus]